MMLHAVCCKIGQLGFQEMVNNIIQQKRYVSFIYIFKDIWKLEMILHPGTCSDFLTLQFITQW